MEVPDYYSLPAHKVLAHRVRLLRTMHRWSQETLAELCELHRTYIGAVERAECNPCLSNIEKIAQALEVPVRHLLDERFENLFDHDRVEEPRAVYGAGTVIPLPLLLPNLFYHAAYSPTYPNTQR